MGPFLSFCRRLALAPALLFIATTSSPAAPGRPTVPTGLSLVANRGQWPAAVQYRAAVPGGAVFLTATGFVYNWLRADDSRRAHAALAASDAAHAPAVRDQHAVFVDFVGARAVAATGEQLQPTYHNYFLGSDPRQWASRVPLFGAVRYAGLYPGTDLHCYGTATGQLEYDFVLAPGANPAAVGLRYRGATALKLSSNGALLVSTSVGDIREQRPVAYQPVAGGRRPVPCRYVLAGNTLRFAFPEGYDQRLPLVIDPVVEACTFSGSRENIYGVAATNDAAGNIYSAGWVYGANFPTTPGAAQTTYAGNTDVGIVKFSGNGTSRLYTTFLGGSFGDQVQALRATATGELCVLTTTSSPNFPVTAGCFDASLNPNGSLALTKLNASGTALIGSTFLGGSSVEVGIELATNASGEVYVLGNTFSYNFPTTPGALSRIYRGSTDCFICCFNSRLTALNWSTLFGSTGSDEARDLALGPNNEPIIAGNTTSPDFPVTAGALQTALPPGQSSFVMRLRADGGALQASTFVGAATITKLTLEADGSPVIAGNSFVFQTQSNSFPVPTPGSLDVMGSGTGSNTFIAGLSSDLRSVRYAARLPVRTLTAFGADDCGHLFLAGLGLPPLPALNPLPNSGADLGFFTMTLDVRGTQCLFASPFGARIITGQGVHVHGYAHRFDRNGRLYQCLCDASGSIPTTAGAAVPTSQVNGQDMVSFIINQAVPGSVIPLRASIAPPDSSCAPYRVVFNNTSVGGRRYRWSFGDGNAADTARTPTHTYASPGTYRVRLLASRDPVAACLGAGTLDSATVLVRVLPRPAAVLPPAIGLCAGSSVTLAAVPGPGYTYHWNTGATSRTIVAQNTGNYRVIVNNGACAIRDSVQVSVTSAPRLSADTSACTNDGIELRVAAGAGSTFRWNTGQTTDRITARSSGLYTVEVHTGSCITMKQTQVNLRRLALRPNIITPNNDGSNDTFVPTPLLQGTRLQVFNRWGRPVFSTDNYQNDWGAGQAPGIYYYLLANEQLCESRLKGWLEVVR
ncbi:DUF7948 domain-containing protein [Hymenobacter sp. UYAg731]